MILVDTPVWSLALRHRGKQNEEIAVMNELQRLIMRTEAVMIGAIRQEILSGIRHPEQFVKLKNRLRAFHDLPVSQNDHELAAEYFNQCRQHGIQGSHINFLICAVSSNQQAPILTTDKDFVLYQQYVPINLHSFE